MRVAVAVARPFYHEFAWAYDALVVRPVQDEAAGMAARLGARGIGPGAAVLDAGCGSGRYAIALARLGYLVGGVDRSRELLAEARAAVSEAGLPIALIEGDLADLSRCARPGGYDAIVCRGVLNDVLGEAERAAVLGAFGRALRPGGVLLLDAREWEGSVARKTGEPVTERRVATPRGTLRYRSVTRPDPAARRLLVSERHTLTSAGGERTAEHELVMQCWTVEELRAGLEAAGFEAFERVDGYVAGSAAGFEDRIVALASRGAR
jgi:2-polyprenyl-3-methyl-5-hydroxy-6-metoxy-1,4-benzoquinol methylase